MISTLVPYMPIEPYKSQIEDYKKSVSLQTAEHEVIIEEQAVERFIHIPTLLNRALERARGDIVFQNDADFLFPDPTLMERMEKKLRDEGLDAILPQYYSASFKSYQVADGGLFITKKALRRFGKFDETLLGVSGFSFIVLDWVIKTLKWHSSKDFIIDLNTKPFIKRTGKVHGPTVNKTFGSVMSALRGLQKHGLNMNATKDLYEVIYKGKVHWTFAR